MFPAVSPRSPWPWALALSACVAVSCSEAGVTSSCPPLPLYETYPLGDASPPDAGSLDSPATKRALAAAVDAGCITERTSFPYDASAGADGDAGGASGGSSGTGSHAGAGGNRGPNAGTAGGN